MNETRLRNSCGGFALMEVLVSIVVFSVGLITVSTFQGDMVQEGNLSKARSEAVNLAQDRLEQLRNLMVEGNYTTIADGQDSVSGVNTTFTRSWDVTAQSSPPRRDVQVTVSWTDAAGDARSVVLESTVAWSDPRQSVAQAGLGTTGNTLPEPSGGELYPDVVYDELPGGIGMGDGTLIVVNEDGTADLVSTTANEDGDYQVILRVESDGFVMLRGAVNVHEGARTTEAELAATIEALTSDAGYCVYPDNGEASPPTYRCYVGNNWYGNSAVIGQDNQDSVCPTLREYDPVAGTHADVEVITEWDGQAIAEGVLSQIPGQDFLIARLTGQDTCDDVLPEGEGGGEEPTETSLTISGSLMVTDGSDIGDTGVTVTPNSDCTLEGSGGYYSFSCAVSYTGGDGWSGHITVEPGSGLQVCSSPNDSNVVYFDGLTENSYGNYFELAASCDGTVINEYTIYIDVTQSTNSVKLVPYLTLTATNGSCVNSWMHSGEKSGTFRCAVSGSPGGSTTISGVVTYPYAGASVTPSSQTVTLPDSTTLELTAGGIVLGN